MGVLGHEQLGGGLMLWPYEISHFPLAEVCNIEQRPRHQLEELKAAIARGEGKTFYCRAGGR